MTDNTTLMKMARESLSGRWAIAIGTFLLYTILMSVGGAEQRLGLITLIIGGPMMLGAAIVALHLSRHEDFRVEQIFDGFKNFSTALVTYLLMVLYVLLWTLLFVIPGIIAALSYSMTFFLLADEPELKAQEVLRKSKEMMDGYKMKLFGLYLWLLLLALGCILTLGIGFLWLIPYAQVTMAKFYEDLKENDVEGIPLYEEKEIV